MHLEKRKKKKAKELLKECKKRLQKNRAALSTEIALQLDESIQQLEQAFAQEQPIGVATIRLDQLAQKHLAPFQKSAFREYFESISVAVVIALFLRSFLLEPFQIPSGSMIPTLQIGDHIFVNKFSYGLWLPILGKKILFGNPPQYGDVIVFIYPATAANEESKDYIKRVVGLPGDSIEMKEKKLFINGKPLLYKKGKVHDYKERIPFDSGPWYDRSGILYQENLFGHQHKILLDDPVRTSNQPSAPSSWSSQKEGRFANGGKRPWGPKVPKGFVFVMGDNRDHSSDSRDWGLVPLKNIKGKATLIWMSMGGGYGTRWNRFFNIIQ